MTQWVDAGWVPREAAPPIDALNARLNAMSGEDAPPLGRELALTHEGAWRSVRALAVAVLMSSTDVRPSADPRASDPEAVRLSGML